MKILGVDVGEHKTGVAICDKTEFLASPVETIKESDPQKLVERIIDIANDNRVKLIIVGHPINMDGSRGERAKACENIAQMITKRSKFEVKMWDERRSTRQASRYLNLGSTKKRDKKKVIDQAAATIILDSFLEYRRVEREKQRLKRGF